MLLSDTNSAARTLFRSKPIPNSRQDRILGALLGAAIGDVMGNAISGLNQDVRKERYGEWGVSAPPYEAAISHYFQLALFALDSIIVNTQKSKKLSVSEISTCLIKCVKEWEVVVNHPKLFHGINHLSDRNSVCSDFMKNYPLWKLNRPGKNTKTISKKDNINALYLALLLCANEKTLIEVSSDLNKYFDNYLTEIDLLKYSRLFSSNEIINKETKVKGLSEMCEQINSSSKPELTGIFAGFEHGAKYGIQGFKQIWYLRIDATNLCEQMGWLIGRTIKSF